ncbi:ParB family protein [Pseudoalteromonas luteoviolacea]|uniref:ParB family protein n=1 Tax=Pseudoalteromonas luteoviolacea TaxID=43657 RepID=UPI001B36BC61|nr:ParB family protein [Pseudoalteromonas luteoviolacea]MBQ4839775.1 chromosome partitioning protein ParB [Pseudoalteromonas luteoviolacea]
MAKRRGEINPLGNTFGSHEAEKRDAKSRIPNLFKQLSSQIEISGEDVTGYLKQHFGVESIGKTSHWQLASGQQASFTEMVLDHTQLKNDTEVNFDINGREQALLNEESVADLDSLTYQQFHPAVARYKNGKIEILDGSRRRAWFLFHKHDGYRVLVTRDELALDDAKNLAKQLQSAKEHNLFEIGQQCLMMQKHNPTLKQADLAKLHNCSQAKISRALKAASVDIRLIQLYPIAGELSIADYDLLFKVMSRYQDTLNDEIIRIQELLAVQLDGVEVHEHKEIISQTLKASLSSERPNKPPVVTSTLRHFESKDMFARKKESNRAVSFEFGRIKKDVLKEIESSVQAILAQHYRD